MSTGGGGGDDNNGNRTVFRPSPLQGLRKPEPAQGTAFVPSQGHYQQPDAQAQQAAYVPANPPIVMLDDVFSELDRTRSARVVHALTNEVQCLLTTTEMDQRPELFGEHCNYFHIEGGNLREEA